MIQLSVHGPATIGQFLKKMLDQRNNDEIFCLKSIESCGLHTASNALQNGAKNNWKVGEVLKSLWKLLQEK